MFIDTTTCFIKYIISECLIPDEVRDDLVDSVKVKYYCRCFDLSWQQTLDRITKLGYLCV